MVSLGFDANGKRIRKKVSGQTRTEVKDKLKKLHSELDAGVRTAAGYTVDMAAPIRRRRCRRAHNCLTRALRHAEGRDLVRRSVSALVDTPRGREGRPSRALTLEQAAALLEAAEDSRLHAYIVLCLLSGETIPWRVVAAQIAPREHRGSH